MEDGSERQKQMLFMRERRSLQFRLNPSTITEYTHAVIPLLSHSIMPELKIDRGKAESSVGAARLRVNTVLLKGLTLSLIFVPLCFKRQKGAGVRDEEWTRLCDCSDAWEAISVLSVPPPPLKDVVEDIEWAESSRKLKERGCRIESRISMRKDKWANAIITRFHLYTPDQDWVKMKEKKRISSLTLWEDAPWLEIQTISTKPPCCLKLLNLK